VSAQPDELFPSQVVVPRRMINDQSMFKLAEAIEEVGTTVVVAHGKTIHKPIEISSSALKSAGGGGFHPKFTSIEVRRSETITQLIRKITAVDLDYDALNVFLRIGTFIGTDTPYRHIKADAPDYAWVASTPAVEGTRTQIIDGYVDLFRQAIKRCGTEEQTFSVGLSGGRDSRHLLLELCRSGRVPAYCWTIDLPWNRSEVPVAKEICERLHIPHEVFTLSGKFAAFESQKNRLTSFSSLQHAWMMEAIAGGMVTTPVIFDGLGGDVLSAGEFLTARRLKLLNESRIDELVEDIVGSGEKVMVVRQPSLFPRWRALDKVSEEFRKHLRAPDPISSFYFWNRTRRDTGCSALALLRSSSEVHTPYLDPDLSRYLAGIPPSMTVDHQLHTDTIRKAFPQHANIAYASKKNPAGATAYHRKVSVDALRYLLRNGCPTVWRAKVCFQLLRALALPKYSGEGLHVGGAAIYLTELSKWIAS
jgi:asparagine synthase (glutamine-hydrolysing)